MKNKTAPTMFPGVRNILIRKNMCNEDEFEIENIEKCPDCQTLTIKQSEDQSYEYCTRCGLITRASITYVAGQRIHLPYGILLIWFFLKKTFNF